MYFRFGKMARPGLKSKTCFEAVKAGERTSTTRFESDSSRQYENWRKVRPGDEVVFWSGPWKGNAFSGESLVCVITEAPRLIDLREFTEADQEKWSQVEGWAPTWIDFHLGKGGSPIGIQIRYKVKN